MKNLWVPIGILQFLILSLVKISVDGLSDSNTPIVRTRMGAIQGILMSSFNDKNYYAFRGIPYAKPPVGPLRFAPPQPVKSWKHIILATDNSAICPQPTNNHYIQAMSEDCLMINVYSSNLSGKLPVLVYIHGGENVVGSGHSHYEAGPDYLLDHEIVFVAFNYRLGVFGFLSTGAESEYSGNFGYLDQLLALHWIQEHIASFGGNPELVTIFGVNSGSMAVTLHLVSPMSKNLFHRAIVMSGSATNHYNIDNVFWTRKVARDAGCPMYEENNIVQCLRNVSWERLIELCQIYEPFGFVNLKWYYEIDYYFLFGHPTEILASGKFNKVPIMIGITKNEFDYEAYRHIKNTYFLNDVSLYFEEYAPEFFMFNYDPYRSRKIKQFYFGNGELEINSSNIQNFGKIFSDSIIGHGVHRLVDIARKFTNVYYYRTDYIGERTNRALQDEDGHPIGVTHTDDLQYILPGTWYGPRMDNNKIDVFMIDRMTSWFVTFANFGKPDVDDYWKPCTANTKYTLYNNVDFNLNNTPYNTRYQLWDELFPAPSQGVMLKSNLSLLFGLIIFSFSYWAK